MTYRTFRTVLNRNTAYIAERSVPERLAALDVPVLVIFGAADRRWDPSSAHHYDAVPTAPVESESTAEMERALDSSLGADWNRLAGTSIGLVARRASMLRSARSRTRCKS